MKKYIILITSFLFLLVTKSFSQVTTSIVDVTINSQSTINNCGLIDFGTTTNNSISVNFKLAKPSAQAIGTCIVKVYLKYSSASNSTKGNYTVQNTSWSNSNTEFSGTMPAFNISESDIQVTGSSIYIECTTDGGLKTISCEYPLKKTPTPTFTLTPPNVQVGCNDTSARTFTVSSANVPDGSVITYVWSRNGWLGTANSDMSSVTLTPSSSTSLPSNVSVTPYVNGVAYPSKTCTVTRESISFNGSISGSSAVCSSGTYSFSGLLTGQTVTWSLSNSTTGTLSTTSGTSTTLTKTGGGTVQLKATVSNACTQSYNITKSIIVGSPMPLIDNFTCITDNAPCFLNVQANNNYLIFNLSASLGSYVPLNSDWEWEKISGNFNFLYNGQYNSSTTTGRQGNIYLTGVNPTDNPLQFKCRVKNACGWGDWRIYQWNDGTITPPVVIPPPAKYYAVVPNPTGGYAANISLLNTSIVPPTTSPIIIKLYTIFGQLLSTSQMSSISSGVMYIYQFNYNTMYITISYDDHIESHTIVKY